MWLSLENGWRSWRLLGVVVALVAACGPGGTGTGILGSITILGPSAVKVGETLHLTAEARDEKGALVSGVTFSWKSSNPNLATIANGDLRGVAVGRVLISAQDGNASADALIVVTRPSPSTGPSSGQLIDAALAAHTIDEETAFKYKVFAAFGDARLPVNYQGNDSSAFESSAVETLNERFDSLSPATQDALGAFLLRPSSIGSWADPGSGSAPSHSIETSSAALGSGRPTCRGETSSWTTAGPSTAKVKVWYDYRIHGHKEKAEIISNAIEQRIWPKLIDTLRFKEPAPDNSAAGCFGGDSRLDVYLVSNVNFRGNTAPEGLNNKHAPTYIMIRDDSDGDLPGLIAHEIMHAIQWAYTTKASQPSYGWLRDASANWAIDAVYGRDTQVEQQYADCFLTTPALPLEDRTTGHCIMQPDVERDYGAYLLFQYIAHTSGEAAVKSVIEATETMSTGVEALNAGLGGRLKDTWPEFAKTLWNKDPIDAKPASFRNWDGLTQAAKSRDIAGDLGGQPESTETLEREQPDLSSRYYHFTFAAPNTRSMLFYNGFFDQHRAGKAIKVLAVWRDGHGNWQEEDWSRYEFVGLCRDMKNQRTDDLTIIVTNGEWSPGGGGKVTAARAPYLKRNNIGCWKYSGTTTALEHHPTWSGTGLTTMSNLVFQLPAGADSLTLQHPAFPDTLRAGLFVMAASGTDYTFSVSYSTGVCTFSLTPPRTFQFQMPTDGGFLYTNSFPELRTTDSVLQRWLAFRARSYQAVVGTTRTVIATVTGPGCHPTEMVGVGALVMSNGTSTTPPVAEPDGKLTYHYTYTNTNWTWTLSPQSEP